MKVSIKKINAFALYQSYTLISNNTTDVLTTYNAQKSADVLKSEAEAVTKAHSVKNVRYNEYVENRNAFIQKYSKPERVDYESGTFEIRDEFDAVTVRKELTDIQTEYKDALDARNEEIKAFNTAFVAPDDCSDEDKKSFEFECDLSKVKLSVLSKIENVPATVTKILMQYDLIVNDIEE